MLAIETRPISWLIPYVGNARTHSADQFAQIAGSIAEFGFVKPSRRAGSALKTTVRSIPTRPIAPGFSATSGKDSADLRRSRRGAERGHGPAHATVATNSFTKCGDWPNNHRMLYGD
jgi:hypothetical protein